GGYYIHTSGTGFLEAQDITISSYGDSSAKVFDDFDGIRDIPHRKLDRILLSSTAMTKNHVKTAIVAPPCTYGVGRGACNRRSLQVPELARCTLQQGHGFTVESGQAIWSEVHVHDLSQLFVLLIEAAAAKGGSATWGADGFYFAENGSFAWGDT